MLCLKRLSIRMRLITSILHLIHLIRSGLVTLINMKWRILFIMAIIVLGLQFSTASKAMRARVSIGTELVNRNGVSGFDLSLSLSDFI